MGGRHFATGIAFAARRRGIGVSRRLSETVLLMQTLLGAIDVARPLLFVLSENEHLRAESPSGYSADVQSRAVPVPACRSATIVRRLLLRSLAEK